MAVYLIGEIGMGAKEAWGLTSWQLLNFHAYSIQELRMRMPGGVSNSSKMSRQRKLRPTIVARLVFRRIRDGLSACCIVPESSHFVASARDSRDGVTFVPTPVFPSWRLAYSASSVACSLQYPTMKDRQFSLHSCESSVQMEDLRLA